MQSAGDILVVDDEKPIVEFMAELLADEGYTVRTALTPSEAYRAIADWQPDLVLVDLFLASTTGDVLMRELKANGMADVPMVLMTADATSADNLAIEGVEFCLIKPFHIDDLLDCVANHIRRKRTAAA